MITMYSILILAITISTSTTMPGEPCNVQLTGQRGYCMDARTCIAGYPQLLSSRLRPVLPLLTKVHDCPSITSMCCPNERVAAVQAIGEVSEVLPRVTQCGKINLNGTNYTASKYTMAEIDDYLDMAQEVTNNIDVEDEHFEDELFDLIGATGNFRNLTTGDLVLRAEEAKKYAKDTNFHGGLVEHGQFNFVARLQYDTETLFSNDIQRLCGGVLINPAWVLTACHCLKTTTGKLTSVKLGGYDDDHPHTQTIPVERTYANPNYKGRRNNYQNDIGLVKLKREADLSDGTVSIACLPSISKQSLLQKYVFAIGWGLVNIDGAGKKGLKFARLPIVPTKECNSVLSLNPQSQICAGGDMQDTCYGDSGAPLVSVVENENGEHIAFVAGVTSYGPDQCGTWGRPGVYTNVHYFMPWIMKHLNSGKKFTWRRK